MGYKLRPPRKKLVAQMTNPPVPNIARSLIPTLLSGIPRTGTGFALALPASAIIGYCFGKGVRPEPVTES